MIEFYASEVLRLTSRVDELLAANTREVERRRRLEAALTEIAWLECYYYHHQEPCQIGCYSCRVRRVAKEALEAADGRLRTDRRPA